MQGSREADQQVCLAFHRSGHETASVARRCWLCPGSGHSPDLMLQDWWHYFLGQSQTLDYLDVFLQTYSSEGFSGLAKAPRQKQQWWGMGVEDTEWPDEAMLLLLPPQVPEGRFLQSGMGMGSPGSKLGVLKLKFIRLFASSSLLSFLSF